jgi:hypothetical protein
MDALLEPFEQVTTNLRYRILTIAVNLRAASAQDGDARDRWARAYGNGPLRKAGIWCCPSCKYRHAANITHAGVKGHNVRLKGYVVEFESQNPLLMLERQGYLVGYV